jgi:hypothetical protein
VKTEAVEISWREFRKVAMLAGSERSASFKFNTPPDRHVWGHHPSGMIGGWAGMT